MSFINSIVQGVWNFFLSLIWMLKKDREIEDLKKFKIIQEEHQKNEEHNVKLFEHDLQKQIDRESKRQKEIDEMSEEDLLEILDKK